MRIPRPGPEARRRWRQLPLVVGVLLVVGLLGAMAIEPTRQLLAQRDRVADARAHLRRMERLNDKLAGRIERLNDPDYLEQRAREQMGLVYPGETSYIVMPDKKRKRVRNKGVAAAEVAPPDPPFVEGLIEFVGLGWAL